MKIETLDQSSAVKMEKLRGPYNEDFLSGRNGLKSMQPTLFWKVLFVSTEGSPLFNGAWKDGVFVDSFTVPNESVKVGTIESNPLVPQVALSDGRATPYTFKVGFYVDIYGSIEKNIYTWLKSAAVKGTTLVKKCTVDVFGYPMGGKNDADTIDPYIQYRFYDVFPTNVDEYTYDHKNQKWANVRKVSFVFTDYDVFVGEVKYEQKTTNLYTEGERDGVKYIYSNLNAFDRRQKKLGVGVGWYDRRDYNYNNRPIDPNSEINSEKDNYSDNEVIGDPRFGLKIVHDKYYKKFDVLANKADTSTGWIHYDDQEIFSVFPRNNSIEGVVVGRIIRPEKNAIKDSTMKYPRSEISGFEESARPGRQSPITSFIQTAVNAYITPDTPHYHGNMKVISKVIRKVQQWFYEEPKHKDVPTDDRIERHLPSWKVGVVGVKEDDHLNINGHGPTDVVPVEIQDNAQLGTHTNGPQVKVYDYDMISMHKKKPGLEVDPNDHTLLTGHEPSNGVVVDKDDMTANETHQDPNNVDVDPNDHTSNTSHQDPNNVGVDPNDHTGHTTHGSVNRVNVDGGDHTNNGSHMNVREVYSPEPDHLVSSGAIDVPWVNTEINDQVDATVIKIKRVVVGPDEAISEDISIDAVEPIETGGETSKSVLYNGNRPQKLDNTSGKEVTDVVDTPDVSNIEASVKTIKRNEPLSHEDKGKKVNPDVGSVDVDKLNVRSISVESNDTVVSSSAFSGDNSSNYNKVSSSVQSIVDHRNDSFTKVENDKEKLDLNEVETDLVSISNQPVEPPSHIGKQKMVNPENSFLDLARRIAEGKMVDIERQKHFTFKVDKIVSTNMENSIDTRKIPTDIVDVGKYENAIREKRDSGKIVDVHVKDKTEISK